MPNRIKTKSPFNFTLPDELSAKNPPELRGINRDRVKLMVVDRESGNNYHSTFNHLADFLKNSDLLVFNSSRTLPASLKTINNEQDQPSEIRLAGHLPDDSWLVLILYETDSKKSKPKPGQKIEFDAGLSAVIERKDYRNPRLWKIKFSETGADLINLFYKIGQPIRYGYISAPLPLEYYLTVFAKDPGSSEMPSAGRAFTWKMLFDLRNNGIGTTFLTLHTGLSSYMDENHNRPHIMSEEEYSIPDITANRIESTKNKGGRIIAVGTTVVRALESSASVNGNISPGHSYTTLRITRDHELKIADGLITGFHEPEATHLDLISAFLKPEQIRDTYEEAIERKYLWHEFGDLCLIL